MLTAIFLTHYLPSDVGHGGNHRAYQILHDLREVFGVENVIVVSLKEWLQTADIAPVVSRPARNIDLVRHWIARGLHVAERVARRVRRVLRRTLGRHLLLGYWSKSAALVDSQFRLSPGHTLPFVLHYRAIVSRVRQPAVCFVEHVGMTECIRANHAYGIPTVSCADNVESLDARLPDARRLVHVLDTTTDLAHEFVILGQCLERLFISKVETALVGGLGLPSHFYPYVPRGAIRERMLNIGRVRHAGGVEAGLFVLVGTVLHSPTELAFAWFIRQARRQGLPPAARIVIAGWGTETLLQAAAGVPGIEVKGSLAQADLDDLLTRAAGVLVPNLVGFGALTRLPELACADIPMIVSPHVTYALDPPPGVLVADDWEGWCRGMDKLARCKPAGSEAEYLAWEAAQPQPIQTLAARWGRIGLSAQVDQA